MLRKKALIAFLIVGLLLGLTGFFISTVAQEERLGVDLGLQLDKSVITIRGDTARFYTEIPLQEGLQSVGMGIKTDDLISQVYGLAGVNLWREDADKWLTGWELNGNRGIRTGVGRDWSFERFTGRVELFVEFNKKIEAEYGALLALQYQF